jgi:nucleoside-diphosphate-sugar epimerase
VSVSRSAALSTGGPAPRGGAEGLTVAVTGPTGTLGFGLVPLLESDERITRIVGIARRRFDPVAHGWRKMVYRQGDVRDRAGLERAFGGADVVVHLAFSITGMASVEATRAVNIDGTLNAFRAAAATGASRFVYASSVAAYGFHRDNPIGMTEDWPVRGASWLFYAQEKAELENFLREEAARHPEVQLYVLRPSIVLGPHAAGAKGPLRGALNPMARLATRVTRGLPVRLPVLVPALPMQFVHEDDVGQALLLCVVAAGPAGCYNIAGDGIVTAHDVVRELGLAPLPFPVGLAHRAARLLAGAPTPPLGWRPRYSGLQALRWRNERGRYAGS